MITFQQILCLEQAYKGNLGMVEMMRFYQSATPEQKKQLELLIRAGRKDEAWALIQSVTHVKLEEV